MYFVAGPDERNGTAALFDQGEERFLTLRVLATSTWLSESGGAPIAWVGGNSLAVLPGDALQELEWGNYGHQLRIYVDPVDSEILAERLVAWLVNSHSGISAAIWLETLRLPGNAPSEEIAQWAERQGEVPLIFNLNLEPDVAPGIMNDLRRALMDRDTTYRHVATRLRTHGGNAASGSRKP